MTKASKKPPPPHAAVASQRPQRKPAAGRRPPPPPAAAAGAQHSVATRRLLLSTITVGVVATLVGVFLLLGPAVDSSMAFTRYGQSSSSSEEGLLAFYLFYTVFKLI
jgi:hypothetical protein